MKFASISLKRIPPALDIARAIGATPLIWRGTSLIRAARSAADSDGSAAPEVVAISCSKPIPAGESCVALRSQLEKDCLPLGMESRSRDQIINVQVGPQCDARRRLATRGDCLAQLR